MDKLIKPSNSSIYLQKNPATHCSTSDWDFGNPDWELSATRFISVPTSLHFTNGDYAPQLLKQSSPTVGKIPQGQLQFHVWPENPGISTSPKTSPSVFVRHNSPDGEALYVGKYWYMLTLLLDKSRLYRRGSAGTTTLGDLGNLVNFTTWNYYRLYWWWSKNALNQLSLAFRLDKHDGADWVIGTPIYDLEADVEEEAYQRIGFGAIDFTASYYDVYFDDCHLYK